MGDGAGRGQGRKKGDEGESVEMHDEDLLETVILLLASLSKI